MEGIDSHFARFSPDKLHRLPAKSAPTVGGVDVQLVDKCIVAMALKAEAQRQDNITDRFVPFTQKPNFPEGGKRQEPPEGHTNCGLVKLNLSRLMLGKMAHHAEELHFVLEGRFPNYELRPIIPRFARLVLRPGRSSRFDGWRRGRRRCRHENIRRKG